MEAYGGIGRQGSPPHTTTAKITTKLQNNYHPGSSENGAVWKSDQGIEVTFIQMGKGVGDVERCRETEWVVLWSQAHVQWINIGRDTSGMRDPSPIPDHPAQGSSVRKMSPHNFWL